MHIGRLFQTREEGPRNLHHEEILRFVQQALDDINWILDQAQFYDLLASKKDSAPGHDGTPHGIYRCAGGLGSKFLFHAYPAVCEGSTIPTCFAESRTVFIPKTSDTDDLRWIIRSPDALRPLTLCNCECEILTSAICRGLHWYTMRCIHTSQRCISSWQMTDNILEIESTALVHVSCAPRESGVLLNDFAASYPSFNHFWIFSVLEHTGLPDFLCRLLRSTYRDSITHVKFSGAKRGQFLMAREVRQVCPASGFLQLLSTLFSDGSKNLLSQGASTIWNSYSLHSVLTPMISPFLLHPVENWWWCLCQLSVPSTALLAST